MLIDKAEITVKGGHGGAGCVSFGFLRRSGPDGGNGGKGGDLYIRATSDLTLLNQYTSKFNFVAPDGENGSKNKKTGKGGDDIELLVPVGTVIINKITNEEIVEFKEVDQKELIVKGGNGGWGNFEFRSPTRTTPDFAKPGLPGDKLDIILNLKLIADYGLIGLPNAGKSSLLNELTRAQAKTANYPFTTLTPNLGAIGTKFIADIPGLIEGASDGKGLGIEFLKHIEKVKVLIHCISSESQDFEKDYKIVRNEMGKYNKELLKKKEIVIITKSDMTKEVKKFKNGYNVSIHDWDSIINLKKLLI